MTNIIMYWNINLQLIYLIDFIIQISLQKHAILPMYYINSVYIWAFMSGLQLAFTAKLIYLHYSGGLLYIEQGDC